MAITIILLMFPLPVEACWRTGCRGIDPYDSFDSSGRTCAQTALTVSGSGSRSGSYGTVMTELRWSSGCQSNWARATATATNSNSKCLRARVSENATNWYYYYDRVGNPLAQYTSTYPSMVDGDINKVSTTFGGISSGDCSGPYDPSYSYEG